MALAGAESDWYRREKVTSAGTESQPAVAGASIKPGVERSGTPGSYPKIMRARAGDSVYISGLSAATRTAVLRSAVPGVPLRFTPGFMLAPATAG